MFDQIVLLFDEIRVSIGQEMRSLHWFQWLLITFPMLLLGDFLYYYVPAVLAAIITPLRATREQEEIERYRQFVATNPRVSVIVAGRNEEACIGACLQSLLELEYPNLEIVFVDDCSEDRTFEIASEFARDGRIRALRNGAASGRGGRPSATNLGVRMSTGEFIVSVDADTTFDRGLITHMIGPFHDPRVGVVAGNLKARNATKNFVTRMQSIEYLVGIGMGKRWTDLRKVTYQASGALGAFRKEAVLEVGQWDSELAEDTDISLKIQRSGSIVRFSPHAIALTTVPESLRDVGKQRYRWDRGALRTYYHKHGSMMNPLRYRTQFAIELLLLYYFSTIATLMFPIYTVAMLFLAPMKLAIVLGISYVLCIAASMLTTFGAVANSERRGTEWSLIGWAVLLPFYKEYLRWVRFDATVHELLGLNYEDSFLPAGAWRCAPRW